MMMNRLKSAWERRDPGLPYTDPYQALIMASLVEKETGQKSERGLIAGVSVNRLKTGMLLQTDPTVIYGLGDKYDGKIHKKDLETDTPYNTDARARRHAGRRKAARPVAARSHAPGNGSPADVRQPPRAPGASHRARHRARRLGVVRPLHRRQLRLPGRRARPGAREARRAGSV